MTSQQENEESAKNFADYSFATSTAWQEYFRNIYPVPSMSQIDRIKRKWYKSNIDAKFELTQNDQNQKDEQAQKEAQPEAKKQPQQQNENQNQQNSADSPSSPKMSMIIETIYTIEGYLKISFFLSFLLFSAYTTLIAFIICFCAVLRMCKRPRFNKVYGEKLIRNEFAHNMLFLVPVSLIPQRSFIFFFPIIIHFWVGICEFIHRRHINGLVYKYGKKYIDLTRGNRLEILYYKSKFEVNLVFIMIVLALLGQVPLMAIFIYGNFIRVKYMINYNTQRAFQETNYWIESKLDMRFVPQIIKTIYQRGIKRAFIWLIPSAPNRQA